MLLGLQLLTKAYGDTITQEPKSQRAAAAGDTVAPSPSVILGAAAAHQSVTPFVAAIGPPQPSDHTRDDVKRAFTVDDLIEMTTYAEPTYLSGVGARYIAAKRSPDGNRFLFVVRKGDLASNLNDYSLLLFALEGGRRWKAPETLVRMSSSSNRPAIQQVSWVDDRTAAFLGEQPGGSQQLYSYDLTTRVLQKRTHHSTNLLSYAVSEAGRLFFVAEPELPRASTENRAYDAIHVTDQQLPDLLTGSKSLLVNDELYVAESDGSGERRVWIHDKIVASAELFASPDGRHLLIPAMTKEVRPGWASCGEEDAKGARLTGDAKHFLLVDANDLTTEPLFDAPTRSWFPKALWERDGRSVVIVGACTHSQTLDTAPPKEFVVEVSLSDRRPVPIVQGSMKLLKWSPARNSIVLNYRAPSGESDRTLETVQFSKTRHGWKQNKYRPSEEWSFELEEAANTPPELVAHYGSRVRTVVYQLNPRLAGINLARVEEIHFRTSDGRQVSGALYVPPTHVAGSRMPLVIQTHGLNPERFWPDGPYSSAFAAQPLAGRGIFVAQLEGDPKLGTYNDRSAAGETAEFEGAIDDLDSRGLIDRQRVGIIGFSWTTYAVKYALTHSKYRFAAATLADGNDMGYFAYITSLNMSDVRRGYEAANRGAPFGAGLQTWLDRAPAFRLQQVTTPVRIEAYSPFSLLWNWEWFVGLDRLTKPVDMLYMPGAAHVLERPWDRAASQGGNVDWFDFWLNGHEDPKKTKLEQYAQWETLCDRQIAAEPDRPVICVRTKPH
jgi:dipeptidyl aminopeptidase/acylaminoacyl peptidase